MIETMRELRSELRGIRQDIRRTGMRADPVIVSSWLDRMAICMEKAMDSMDLMQEQVDVMSGPSFTAKAGKKAPARKARKKTAKRKTAARKKSSGKAKKSSGRKKRKR